MANRVVTLLGHPIINEESAAAEAITPGHLVDFDGSGALVKHAGQGLNAAKTFALEREEMGNDIDDAYAIGDRVKVAHMGPGMRVNGFIASGVTVAVGTFLESNGDGTLRAIAEDSATDDDQRIAIVGRSLEVLNNSAGPGAVRCRVEIV